MCSYHILLNQTLECNALVSIGVKHSASIACGHMHSISMCKSNKDGWLASCPCSCFDRWRLLLFAGLKPSADDRLTDNGYGCHFHHVDPRLSSGHRAWLLTFPIQHVPAATGKATAASGGNGRRARRRAHTSSSSAVGNVVAHNGARELQSTRSRPSAVMVSMPGGGGRPKAGGVHDAAGSTAAVPFVGARPSFPFFGRRRRRRGGRF